MNHVLLFNPWSARNGYRIPNSILQVAASIDGLFAYTLVDGNREKDAWATIKQQLDTGLFRYFGCTVMPGPQLRQAIPFTKRIKEIYPHISIIWGGYFAANQYKACLSSGLVDYIINGPGDEAFPKLLQSLEQHRIPHSIPNLIFLHNHKIVKTPQAPLPDQDLLPALPYHQLHKAYPLKGYLKKTFLGKRTAAYHTSMGCPFTCAFCAVVPIYQARWKGKSAPHIYQDLQYLIKKHGADAVEFHDNNFFVSEKRTVAFANLIKKEKIQWWGEGRIDTLSRYSDHSLARMRDAGCKMIFFGAETSNDTLLKTMDKGGTQSAQQVLGFAARLKQFDIIPEYSFVLGFPADNEAAVNAQINQDIAFIQQIKAVNPATEIIIYLYSPVPTEGSTLYEHVKNTGFKFPETLDDWLQPAWESFDLRRNPLTPWLKPYMVDKIHGFETVLNGYYPTQSLFNLTSWQRKSIKMLAAWRYRLGIFRFPYEIKLLQKYWLHYQRPETEGFAMKE